jgi:DNA ligase (NAD+)
MDEKMKTLIEFLNSKTQLYIEGTSDITDEEWDDSYFELLDLENKAGYALPNSPTQKIIFNTVSKLEKVEHNHKMLSLDKTKDIKEVEKFLGNNDYIAMCKMDGLTCSLKYEHGYLVSAETRGDGLIGENILHNILVIPNIPKRISYTKTLVVDGEIICNKYNFKHFENEYENCRNFAAGSIRLLDSKECARRMLQFIAWDAISGYEQMDDMLSRLICLQAEGFEIVPFTKGSVENCISELTETAKDLYFPIDGIVFKFNNIEYGNSLGATDHHFRNAIAFKFYDEKYKTILRDIEWSIGRTGVLTPVAIFDPVDDGESTYERASLHNVSILNKIFDSLPCVGQTIWTYKSNQIIPQVYKAENEEKEVTHPLLYPSICPICGGSTQILLNKDTEILVCSNPNCEGKLINKLDHFCGKKGLDIKGLSKATLEKLIDWGWVENIVDIFNLERYKTEWTQKSGFGEKSVTNILTAIENSKETTAEAFISALGIPLIGKTVAMDLMSHFTDYSSFRSAVKNYFDFSQFDGFAESKTEALLKFNYDEADTLYYSYLRIIPKESKKEEQNCDNIKVVITGKLIKCKNRAELKSLIESRGGKVVESISKNTTFLINNDITSASSKNKEAQKLGIPILSEEEFLKKFF